jgi:hypothetical protein
MNPLCQVEADRSFVCGALGASLYMCRCLVLSCLEAIKEAVLANGNTPEWTWTESKGCQSGGNVLNTPIL